MAKETLMQHRFSHSKYFRRASLEVIGEETGGAFYGPGSKRLMQYIWKNVYSYTSEAQIKRIMLGVLQCYDISEEQRQEALYILAASQTALTKKQKQLLQENLFY